MFGLLDIVYLMKSDKIWVQKMKQKNSISKKKQKEVIASEIVEEKKINNSSESNISVLTKTTNPKVVINSEDFKNCDENLTIQKKHKLLKTVCFMIICIIILMTFFISLKTYNMVNELSYYIMQP
jgi:hypothetical protein